LLDPRQPFLERVQQEPGKDRNAATLPPLRRPIAPLENDHCLQWPAAGFTEPPNLETRWPVVPYGRQDLQPYCSRVASPLAMREFSFARGACGLSKAERDGPENGARQVSPFFLDEDRRPVIGVWQGFGE